MSNYPVTYEEIHAFTTFMNDFLPTIQPSLLYGFSLGFDIGINAAIASFCICCFIINRILRRFHKLAR